MTARRVKARCPICKAVALHYRSATAKSGHQYECIDCHRESQRLWHANNREKVQAMRARNKAKS